MEHVSESGGRAGMDRFPCDRSAAAGDKVNGDFSLCGVLLSRRSLPWGALRCHCVLPRALLRVGAASGRLAARCCSLVRVNVCLRHKWLIGLTQMPVRGFDRSVKPFLPNTRLKVARAVGFVQYSFGPTARP